MKKNHMLFTVLFLIYAGAGVISLVAFGVNGSYLSRRQEVPASAATDPELPADPIVEPVEEPAEDPFEDPVENPTPDPVENSTDNLTPETPDPAAPAQEPAENPQTPVPATEPADDSEAAEAGHPVTGSTSGTPEPADETNASDDEEAAGPEKTYYAFTVIDGVTDVRIRETDARDSNTVSHIDGGKSGYVLEKGDSRSKILTKKGTVGYIYNEYLTFSEIPKDEFPEEYR